MAVPPKAMYLPWIDRARLLAGCGELIVGQGADKAPTEASRISRRSTSRPPPSKGGHWRRVSLRRPETLTRRSSADCTAESALQNLEAARCQHTVAGVQD